MAIHPTAVIDSKAKIGREVSIGPWSVIGPDVTLGDGVRIAAHVVIDGRTTVGAGTEVHPFAMLGAQPGHLKDRGEGCELVIGERCSLREHVSLHRGTREGGGRTVIGDETSVFAHAHVGHDCRIGRGVLLTNACMVGGHVQMADYVILGGGSVVHQHCRVGTLVMVQGISGIGMDAPPYTLIGEQRGRMFGLNEIGLERRGFTAATIQALRGAYRTVFRSGLLRAQALERAQAEHGGVPEVAHFLDFIRSAGKRGVMRHSK